MRHMGYNTDELIDFNLRLLQADRDIRPLEFRGLDNKILERNVSEAVFAKMVKENLINTDNYYRASLTTDAYDILNYGGWLKYQNDTRIEKANQESRNQQIQDLELKNFELQKESLEYAKTVRAQDEQIRKLTLRNLKRYILFSIISFISGAVLTNIKDIIKLFLVYLDKK